MENHLLQNRFINQLKKEECIKMCCMIEPTYWHIIPSFNEDYETCKIYIEDDSLCNIEKSLENIDLDIIMLYCKKPLDELKRIKLQDMLDRLSKKHQKRITFSYFYLNLDGKSYGKVEIISQYIYPDYKEVFLINNKDFSPIDFINHSFYKHNEIKEQLNYQKRFTKR